MSIDTKYDQTRIIGNKRSGEESDPFIPNKLSKTENESLTSLLAAAAHILRTHIEDRPNLIYYFTPKIDSQDQLYNFMAKHRHESGVIYATTRKVVDSAFFFLQQQGFKVGKSHGGISYQKRIAAQKAFMKEEIFTIITTGTSSFGIKINKPNIRYILHHGMPASIEQYYQEISLAGKDGLPADCLLLYSSEDNAVHNHLQSILLDNASIKLAKEETKRMYDLCLTRKCRRLELMNYFQEFYPSSNCAKCDNCKENREMYDETVVSQKILACILQLPRSFVINYVIEILRGSQANSIMVNGHNSLACYGSLKKHSQTSLRQYIYSLMQMGFLQQVLLEEKYPVLQLTEKAYNIMSEGRDKILLPIQRRENIDASFKKRLKSNSSEKTAELFLRGETVEAIAQQRGLAKSTIVDHLSEQIQLGKNLDIGSVIDEKKQKTIREVMAEVGSEKLTPIKERLPEFTYAEICLVAAFSRRGNENP